MSGTAQTPWTNKLFTVKNNVKLLDDERKGIFYTYMMKAICKRYKPDISTMVVVLSTRIRNTTEDDWSKLIKILSHVIKDQEQNLNIGSRTPSTSPMVH